MIELFSGLFIGLFGSLHCVGMCGPLVLSLPLTKKDRLSIASKSLVYNIGRLFTYGLLGLAMGLMGWCLEIGGLQKIFSIALGSIILYSALCHVIPAISMYSYFPRVTFFSVFTNKLKKSLVINNNASAIKIGMLNGLLPCGLVYVALASSVTQSIPLYSSVYMMLFGLGTLPLMFLVMLAGNLYKPITIKLKKLLPLAMAILGVYLIYRGVTLDLTDNPENILNGLVEMRCH
jgi:sulfite exporter TauE/SafE